MALAYGADAVYLAGDTFGMRAFAGNFDREGLAHAVELAHGKGVQVHVTCNTMAATPRWTACPNIWSIWITSARTR